MNFINPIELLQLQNNTYADILNPNIIKRKKKELFADIELSDNEQYSYNEQNIDRSDCERVINELENKGFAKFYYYLTTDSSLNNFLVNGNQSIFQNYKKNKIYDDQEFISFINPFFAERYDKALLNAFNENKIEQLEFIKRTNLLVNQTNINISYKSLTNEINNRINIINDLSKEIEEGTSYISNIDKILDIIKNTIPIDITNALPPYFQSQINKIATSLNNLAIAIDDQVNAPHVAILILEHLLELHIESIGKSIFADNYQQLEEKINSPLLSKWSAGLIKLNLTAKEIEEQTLKPKDGELKIKEINISDLNSLPSFADEIRNYYAYIISSISISIWNKHKNVDSAIRILTIALSISSSSKTKEKLNSDLDDLLNIQKEQERNGKPIKSAPKMSNKHGTGTTIYGDTQYLVVLAIPIIPISRFNCERIYNGYRFYGKLKLRTWQRVWQLGLPTVIIVWLTVAIMSDPNNYSTPIYTAPTSSLDETPATKKGDTTLNKTNDETTSELDPYKGNQLKNGASPLNSCFGKAIYGGNAKLKVQNGSNADAIVCLYSIDSDRTIRNKYIRANSRLTISNIPQGQYKIRIIYGNDWNPTASCDCGGKGNFDSNINFSEMEQPEFFEDSERGFTIAKISLFTSSGKDPSSNSIDKSKFYNK